MLSFKTPEMMNKIIQNQKADRDWSDGKFTQIWERIIKGEQPEYIMTNLELNDDLRGVRLSRKKEQKDSLAEMSTLEIKSGIPIIDSKNVAVVLCAGQQNDYAAVMTITCTLMTTIHNRVIVLEEVIDAMHK